MYNLKDIPTKEFGLIPEGTYDLAVVEVKKGITKVSKKDKLNIRWKIVSEASKNRQFFDDILLQESMLWRLNNALKAIESPLADNEIDSVESIMRAFRNKTITAEIIIEDFKGKESNKIGSFSVCTTQYADSTAPAMGSGTRTSAPQEEDDLPF